MNNNNKKGDFLPSNIQYNPNKNCLDETYVNIFSEQSPFNLSDNNLYQLADNLTEFLNYKPSAFLFLRNRENSKIKIAIDQVKSLNQYMMSLRVMSKEFMELRADSIISNKALGYLVAGKLLDFNHSIELKIEEHKTKLSETKAKREMAELEVIGKGLDNEMKRAQIAALNAKTDEQKEYVEFMKEVRKEYDSQPQEIKLLMYHDFINRNKQDITTTDIKDLDYEKFMKEIAKKLFKENLKQSQAKTTSEQSKAEHDKWRTDKKTGKL